MEDERKISIFQIFSVFFICRILSFFTFITPPGTKYASGDRLLICLILSVFIIVSCIPVLLILGNKEKNKSILDVSGDSKKPIRYALAVFYAAYFVWAAAKGLGRYELYVSTVMFSGENTKVFTAIILICAVIVALKGIETIGRASVVTGVITTLSIIFVAVSVANKFSFLNLSPILENGAAAPFENAFFSTARTAEPVSLLIAAPQIRGKTAKGLVTWSLFFGVGLGIIYTIMGGVTGLFGDRQIFQLYTLTMLAKIGVFERMDDLITGIWVLCALFRTAYFLFIASKCIETGFEIKKKKPTTAITAVVIFCVYYFISNSSQSFSAATTAFGNEVLYLAAASVIPLIVLVFSKLKRSRVKNEA